MRLRLALVGTLFPAGLVLPVWWLLGYRPRGVPGLGAFPSAYIGDTLLLPVACLILVLGIGKLRPARYERARATAAAVFAATASILVQRAWLDDPTTQPNWTMPRIRHFNAAGWWHAFYFLVMSLVLLVLVVVFLARVRARRIAGDTLAAELSSGRGAAILLGALGSYAALAVHDYISGPGPVSLSNWLSLGLVAIIVLLGAVLTWLAYRHLMRSLVRPALLAAGAAAVVLGFVALPLIIWLPASATLIAAGATIAFLTGRHRPGPHDRPDSDERLVSDPPGQHGSASERQIGHPA